MATTTVDLTQALSDLGDAVTASTTAISKLVAKIASEDPSATIQLAAAQIEEQAGLIKSAVSAIPTTDLPSDPTITVVS